MHTLMHRDSDLLQLEQFLDRFVVLQMQTVMLGHSALLQPVHNFSIAL